MKRFLFVLTFIIIFVKAFSQNVAEIGMSKNEIMKFNEDICFSDTLVDGTPFIKGMLSDKQNFIYYFLDDKDICFCVLEYFTNTDSINKFSDLLSLNYDRCHNLWCSYDSKYFIELIDIGLDYSVYFIWSSTKIPMEFQ